MNGGDAVADKHALAAFQRLPRLCAFHALTQNGLLAVEKDFGEKGVAAINEKYGLLALIKTFTHFPHTHTIVQGIAPLIAIRREAAVVVAVAADKAADGGTRTGGDKQQKARKNEGQEMV